MLRAFELQGQRVSILNYSIVRNIENRFVLMVLGGIVNMIMTLRFFSLLGCHLDCIRSVFYLRIR